MFQCYWVDVLVEDQCHRDSKVEHIESFSTERVGKNFNSVEHDERRKGDAGICSTRVQNRSEVNLLIGRVVQENKGNHTVRGCWYGLLAVDRETYRLRSEEKEHSYDDGSAKCLKSHITDQNRKP